MDGRRSGRGEGRGGIVHEQRLLRAEVLDARAENWPVGRAGAEHLDFLAPEWALPDEQFFAHAPLARSRRMFAGLG